MVMLRSVASSFVRLRIVARLGQFGSSAAIFSRGSR